MKYIIVVFIIIILINIINYKKLNITYKTIKKGTIMYCNLNIDLKPELLKDNRFTWFSSCPYYIYNIKNQYFDQILFDRCRKIDEISGWYGNSIKEKIKCNKINLYKFTLKKDLNLIDLNTEENIHAFYFAKYYKINGFLCTNTYSICDKVFYINFKKNLFDIKPVDLSTLNNNLKFTNTHYSSISLYLRNLFKVFSILSCYKIGCKMVYYDEYYKDDKYYKPKTNKLRIASYNVHYWYDVFENENSINIGKNILKNKPDIICLQEYRNNGCPSNFKNNYQYQYINEYNCVFSKYPILSSKTIQLGRDNKYFFQRYLQICKILVNNKEIYILNTHLDVFDNTEKIRYSQIKNIINEIKKLDDKLVFLMGDFNSLDFNDYTEEYLNNMRIQSGKHMPKKMKVLPEIQKHMYDCYKLNDNYKKNPVTVWSLRKVDYIFVNKKIKLDFRICQNPSSDHNLVYLDCKL